jgi:predicted dehydrogenase
MTKINFAIIGCGKIAERHAKHIAQLGNLVAVCDNVEAKAKALAEIYSVNSYTDIAVLLSSETTIDVVAICTPNGLHAVHAIQVLQAGYHALVEKPMAIAAADCEAMILVANKANKLLFAIKQNRYNPPVVAVKHAIDNNKLGNIYSIQLSCFWNRNPDYYHHSWKGTMALDGGTLFTQFSHFIDLLYWLIGDIKLVHVITKNLAHKGVIDFEDTGVIALEFTNGVIGTINYTVNSYQKNMEGSLTIFAEKGTVKIGGQYLNELEYQNIQDFVIDNLPKGNTANNYGNYVGSMSNHDKVYANVIDVLQNSAVMYTTAFDAMKTVEIIEKIYKAATFTNKA